MSEVTMNLEAILEYLPHRFPFLLVDRVLELVKDDKITALKNVTYNEHFFQGHFPMRPVMPGVLILEAMAQTGGILAFESVPASKGGLIFFMGIDKCKFRQPVVPGDQLILEVVATHKSSRAWKMAGKATVDGKVVAQAELTAAVKVP